MKGVAGRGLPAVVLALLAATVGLRVAMVLMLVPATVTNVRQFLAKGGDARVGHRVRK